MYLSLGIHVHKWILQDTKRPIDLDSVEKPLQGHYVELRPMTWLNSSTEMVVHRNLLRSPPSSVTKAISRFDTGNGHFSSSTTCSSHSWLPAVLDGLISLISYATKLFFCSPIGPASNRLKKSAVNECWDAGRVLTFQEVCSIGDHESLLTVEFRLTLAKQCSKLRTPPSLQSAEFA